MQCRNCGFENMPGIERCVVCSTALKTGQAEEVLTPPRARDRTLWQRLTWPITSSQRWGEFAESMENLSPRTAGAGSFVWSALFPEWLNLRGLGLLLASVIPGLGHILVPGTRRMGLYLLLGGLVVLGLAVPLYRTVHADRLLAAFVALSMFSVSATVDSLRPMGENEARFWNRTGVVLLVLAAYLGSYWLLATLIRPYARIVGSNVTAMNGMIQPDDTLLLMRSAVYTRGDVVVGNSDTDLMNMGPILAMPGDRVRLEREHIYVNGITAEAVVPFVENQEVPNSTETEMTLGSGQYWIMPAAEAVGAVGRLAAAGIVREENIYGRAVLVIGPPEHRKLVRNEPRP